ncbi:MAG: LamG domain-containing protein [Bacteroidales bacterium]|jgi:hypothetical protein|nr:LamG domain-containing protein [Bacteroidales bacterium]
MTKKNIPQKSDLRTEWILSTLTKKMPEGIRIKGKPETIKCKYGKAILFNGSSDAIFIDKMPLQDLDKFTIEIIIQPQSGGSFEQRFLHCGDIQGDRILLELRSTDKGWYLDAFVKTGDQQLALIDPNLLHPSDQWYHLAYVINKGKLETYINGKKELDGNVVFTPLKGGLTSIGVRQNEVSWFKGGVYSVRFTDNVLGPGEFMDF